MEPNLRTRRRQAVHRQALDFDSRGRLVPIGGVDDPALAESVLVPPMTRPARDTPTPPTMTTENDRRAVNHLVRKAVGLER